MKMSINNIYGKGSIKKKKTETTKTIFFLGGGGDF